MNKTTTAFTPMSTHDVTAQSLQNEINDMEERMQARAGKLFATIQSAVDVSASIRDEQLDLVARLQAKLAEVEAWRQDQMNKAADADCYGDYSEGWNDGVDQAMVALGEILGTVICCSRCGEDALEQA